MAETFDCVLTLLGNCFIDWFTDTTIHLNKKTLIMKKNMSGTDRIVRIIVAIVVAVLYYMDQISGIVAIILGILAVVFLLTAFVGTCPLYLPFGLSTKKATK